MIQFGAELRYVSAIYDTLQQGSTITSVPPILLASTGHWGIALSSYVAAERESSFPLQTAIVVV